jgi:hypothetical protein
MIHCQPLVAEDLGDPPRQCGIVFGYQQPHLVRSDIAITDFPDFPSLCNKAEAQCCAPALLRRSKLVTGSSAEGDRFPTGVSV